MSSFNLFFLLLPLFSFLFTKCGLSVITLLVFIPFSFCVFGVQFSNLLSGPSFVFGLEAGDAGADHTPDRSAR